MGWTEEEHQELIKRKNAGWTFREIAELLTEQFERVFTYDSVRNRWRRTQEDEQETPPYKENVELKSDGTQQSDKLIRMSHQDSKNPEYLLQAHGYDPQEWEVVNAKSSIWNQHNKQDGTLTLYASKITVKPKEVKFDWNKVINAMNNIKPVKVDTKQEKSPHYLNVPLFDMHFGVADYSYYIQTQRDIAALLDKPYKEILFIIGQDLLHNDDFRGRTASGREIEKVDMEKSWQDAMYFYHPLITKALKNKVKIIYSKGNHDESMSWAFVQCLKAMFPQIECDDSFKERKVHMLGSNFVGMNHGDKKKEVNLTENFAKEFPLQWSKATTTEIFVGHLHTERLIDKDGVVIRRMPTGNKTDQWHDDMGYTTAHKRFQVFEYTEDKLKTIHYV